MNEKEYLIYLGTDYKDRIRFSYKKEKGKITDLVIQYESNIKDNWSAIVRYDCSHGFFHRDLLYPNSDKEKKVIEISDLNLAFNFAAHDIEDKWEWYKEQYIRKIKNDK